MKIALLSGASSIHTIRWANGLSQLGHEVHVISQHSVIEMLAPGVTLHQFPYRGWVGYFSMAYGVRKILKSIMPDVLNAHYASGYGTTARLANFHPLVLSVWGSDVYDFPYKSCLHRWLVKKNLKAADIIASTSLCMASETQKLLSNKRHIAITPFGVDLDVYASVSRGRYSVKGRHTMVIGTVKALSNKYGIDTLIKAFAIVVRRNDFDFSCSELKLRLVGDGEQRSELEQLAKDLNVDAHVEFVGQVPHKNVPTELSKIDIYVALSRLDSESFGVAIIEASASGCPVVVSNAGGLPEVTIDGETGLVVPREDANAAAEAIIRLIRDVHLRERMGQAGHRHVRELYDWPKCIDTMIKVYEEAIARRPTSS